MFTPLQSHLKIYVSLLLMTGCLAQSTENLRVDAGATAGADGATACAVFDQILSPSCSLCHRAGGQPPDLSFEALPALLDGRYIQPGDPQSSLLYRKMTGELAADEGGSMPPRIVLPTEQIQLVGQWITEGASLDCEPGAGGPQPGRYHPEGFAEPSIHGVELKLGLQDCRDCHGAQLTGAIGPSCDSCHTDGWRSNCTFCHGGESDESGAPPRDLSGEVAPAELTFSPHPEHIAGARHLALDCSSCHRKPEGPLSPGHVFDDTPGRSEVDFSAGLSTTGSYEGEGRCSNLYCHGNGQSPGAIEHTAGALTCNDCHAGPDTGRDRWETMSGEHEEHLREGIDCEACHAGTVDSSARILGTELHVNGVADVQINMGTISRTGETCSGECHGQAHDSEAWR